MKYACSRCNSKFTAGRNQRMVTHVCPCCGYEMEKITGDGMKTYVFAIMTTELAEVLKDQTENPANVDLEPFVIMGAQSWGIAHAPDLAQAQESFMCNLPGEMRLLFRQSSIRLILLTEDARFTEVPVSEGWR